MYSTRFQRTGPWVLRIGLDVLFFFFFFSFFLLFIFLNFFFVFTHKIATGLSYLHNLMPPLIHRDLKSPNIFLMEKIGREISISDARIANEILAKIGDFGLSAQLDHALMSGLQVCLFFWYFLGIFWGIFGSQFFDG